MQSRITYGKWRLQICPQIRISSTFARQTWRGGLFQGNASKPRGFLNRPYLDTEGAKVALRGDEQKPVRSPTDEMRNMSGLRGDVAQSMAGATGTLISRPLANYTTIRKYGEGMDITKIKEEIRTFAKGRKTTYSLPPMAKDHCKTVHAIAEGFNFGSKSAEEGSTRKRHLGLYRRDGSKLHTEIVSPASGRIAIKSSDAAINRSKIERSTRMIFKGLQVEISPRAKLIRQRFSVKNRFKTVLRPPITSASMERTDQFLRKSAIPNYSELEFKRMRSSPSIIIHALKRGRLAPKARNFNFAAWSKEDSATAMVMRCLLAMKPVEIATLRSQARDAAALASAQGNLSSGFKESFLARLDKREYTGEDVKEWAKIALAPDNTRALLYLESKCAVPPYAIFNEVMRKTSLDVRTLRKLITSCRLTLIYFAERRSVTEAGTMQDNQFITIFSILMKHARRIAPSMLPKSIAPLIIEYCKIISLQDSSKARLSERLHKVCNTAVVRFAVTPEKHPMEGMDYAWVAQAKILELGDSFPSSLSLDAPTYRAIIKVLLACKKTEWEEHAVTHLHRTWPPWRKTQDGMDARIQPDDELTRVVSVVRNLIRAGHPKSSFDKMAMILGGRDVDGTPTIPTRTILKANYRKEAYNPISTNTDLEWAARVRATRDIREAWGAFRACTKRGLKPTQGMFEEMIEKLVYDRKRESGARSTPRIPGAGREVAHYHNGNFSETELQRVNPPSIDELLALMKTSGIKLSEKSLCLLIRGAWSPRYARDLMLQYGVDEFAVVQLSRGRGAQNVSPGKGIDYKGISEPIRTAYIQLLCRFSAYKWLSPARHGGRREGRDYLLDVIHILKRAPNLRVAWHTFVKTIALIKNTKGQTTYDFSNSSKLWALLHEALDHRRSMNVVDADHFGYACYGLYNALEGERRGHPIEPGLKQEGIAFINYLWSYLTEVPTEEHRDAFLPTLLHEIKGWQLHAYVRLLAHTRQKNEISNVLSWITEHEIDLDAIALNRSNGLSGLRRTLIAMRVYAISTRDSDYENELREMAERIPQDWGGWATDVEVEEYLDYTSEAEGLRDIDADVRLGNGIIEKGGEHMFSSAENSAEPGIGRNIIETTVRSDRTVLYRPM